MIVHPDLYRQIDDFCSRMHLTKTGLILSALFLIIFDSYLVNGLPLSCATFLWYNLKQADAVTNTHNVQE